MTYCAASGSQLRDFGLTKGKGTETAISGYVTLIFNTVAGIGNDENT